MKLWASQLVVPVVLTITANGSLWRLNPMPGQSWAAEEKQSVVDTHLVMLSARLLTTHTESLSSDCRLVCDQTTQTREMGSTPEAAFKAPGRKPLLPLTFLLPPRPVTRTVPVHLSLKSSPKPGLNTHFHKTQATLLSHQAGEAAYVTSVTAALRSDDGIYQCNRITAPAQTELFVTLSLFYSLQ